MHSVAKFVFWTTLTLFLITLATASYVGVYLIYVAIPLIVISGLMMKFIKPKAKERKPPNKYLLAWTNFWNAAGAAVETVNAGMQSVNRELDAFNQKMEVRNKKLRVLCDEHTLLCNTLLDTKYPDGDTELEQDQSAKEALVKDLERRIALVSAKMDEVKAQY
ncbi:hypothetical protein D515_03990 [Grimontia indica]|uniref:Uncharacterized protein n=1 Tax=Grimontia indica TaxID=1056512 RepID=R1I9B5_9GAMM|nr:cytochrome b/b6 domain-containing protein [Grimontia indica]EOD77326.1 hypothetical protein D515_03990 [Grimontia indica]